jgi:hypothetical protein
MGGGAPAADDAGDVYVATGNGAFDEYPPPPMSDYGDSILRLHSFTGSTTNGVNLSVAGWFTPEDQATLSSDDADLGSGAPILLPDQPSGPAHLLAHIGKGGVVYLIDRENMGHYNASNGQIVQSFTATGYFQGLWGTPAFWQNSLYFAGGGEALQAFTFNPGSAPQFTSSPSSQSSLAFQFPGATPSVSSQGASDGIVWAIDASQYGPPAPGPGAAVLHAYSATNLATEYWNSSQTAGNAVKFVPPTIANGKV